MLRSGAVYLLNVLVAGTAFYVGVGGWHLG